MTHKFDLAIRPAFPRVWDNTMRSDFVTCPHSVLLRFLHGCVPATTSIHLHAGGAFAKGLEATRLAFYGKGMSPDEALAEGLRTLYIAYGEFDHGDTNKSVDRMAGALEYYFAVWPLATDHAKPVMLPNHGPAVEFNFVLPIPEVAHPETGEPILYSGRFDMLANYADSIYVEDDKTTSQLGASWANQWKLRSQFTGYCWGARQFGYKVAGAIVRGVSILKRDYGNAEAIVYRPDWLVDRWYAQLVRDLHRAVDCWREGVWDQNFADGCASYGSCPYVRLCESQDPTVWMNSPSYKFKLWDPCNPYAGEEGAVNP